MRPITRDGVVTVMPAQMSMLYTLADQVGTTTGVLKPLHDLMEAHVLAADRLHGDDTTVPDISVEQPCLTDS